MNIVIKSIDSFASCIVRGLLTVVHLTAGTHMVFFALNIVEALGLLMLFKPFLAEKKKRHSDQLH